MGVGSLREWFMGECFISRAEDEAGVLGGEGEGGAVQVAAAEVDVVCT